MNATPGSFPRRLAVILASFALTLAASVPALAETAAPTAAPPKELPIVPYVPTPQPVVDKMLQMAKVGKKDVVYDLGCGDGRIVITAARKHGARGVGVDLNPARIEDAQANLKEAGAGVAKRVRFINRDLFEVDFSDATVVMLYLLPEVNLALRPRLWKQLAVGTRVVSHDYHMGEDWPPEQTVQIEGRTLYAWTIKAEHKRQA